MFQQMLCLQIRYSKPTNEPISYITGLQTALDGKQASEHKTSFNVTVSSKTSNHPFHGSGSGSGYFIDSIESPVIQFKVGKTYRFN